MKKKICSFVSGRIPFVFFLSVETILVNFNLQFFLVGVFLFSLIFVEKKKKILSFTLHPPLSLFPPSLSFSLSEKKRKVPFYNVFHCCLATLNCMTETNNLFFNVCCQKNEQQDFFFLLWQKKKWRAREWGKIYYH